MNVLIIHNRYRWPGGEDHVVDQERRLLESHGHRTVRISANNEDIRGLRGRVRTAWEATYSPQTKRKCLRIIDEERPDIAHVHNLYPLLTASILDACVERAVPVVMTLHNYRLQCPGATMSRRGRVCTECVHSTPYRAALHRCYRDSFLGSLAAARVVSTHRRRRTWNTKVDRFIALTEFGRRLFVDAGLPADRISIKPNFCAVEPSLYSCKDTEGTRVLFVGRLSRDKGIDTLMAAWKNVGRGELRVAGGSPDSAMPIPGSNVRMLGHLSADEVAAEMRRALFLLMPSVWFEGFPMAIVEAFGHGLPVLVSRLGAMMEIVTDGVTGLHFEPGNPADLASKARWLLGHPEECRRMGRNARRDYERNYTPERNYQLLMEIYGEASEERRRYSQAE